MKFKLIVAVIDDDATDDVIAAARKAGATGATVITSARGEGLKAEKTFLGLDLSAARDIVLFLVVAEKSRQILEAIDEGAGLTKNSDVGIALQLDIEDVVGLRSQLSVLEKEVEDEL